MATIQKLRLTRCVQSSNYENNKYPATNAIDGSHNTFNHTNDGSEEWWQVELENPQNVITQIVITNRTDCCQERLSNFWVILFDSARDGSPSSVLQAAKWKDHRQIHEQKFTYSIPNVNARVLRVQLCGRNALHMADVAVFGYENAPSGYGSPQGGFAPPFVPSGSQPYQPSPYQPQPYQPSPYQPQPYQPSQPYQPQPSYSSQPSPYSQGGFMPPPVQNYGYTSQPAMTYNPGMSAAQQGYPPLHSQSPGAPFSKSYGHQY
eukprot:TRINITY_DN180_c0_g1_i2.p1 TRINITY_DN180_c0_g1~~TRINITY_DN180_c0_g1_i2.p1  ORF type:complete len:262 (-),score=38.04 TRINITY_DN180_c0_g1_i2:111-896(-)